MTLSVGWLARILKLSDWRSQCAGQSGNNPSGCQQTLPGVGKKTVGVSANPKECRLWNVLLKSDMLKRESSWLTTYWSKSTYSSRWFEWTGLAPWEFESPVPGSLLSTFLVHTLLSKKMVSRELSISHLLQFHLQIHMIYNLSSNQDYYTCTSISLINHVLCRFCFELGI